MPLRVLMVTRETGPDRRYGLGRSLLPIVEALRARGVDVRYFCQDDLNALQLAQRERWWSRFLRLRPSAQLQPLGRAWLERLQVGIVAARVARRENYTHVHAHDPWLAAGVALGLLGSSGSRILWGLTQHGFGSYSSATHLDGLVQGPMTQRWMRRIEAWILARASWVVAPSASALDAVAADLCVERRPAHWHVVPHARPDVAAATPATRREARARLGWHDQDFVVLAIGRLAPLKCFGALIEACAALPSQQLRLVILGDGDAHALQMRAAFLGFDARLRITCVDDVSPYLHAADLYVSASATESFGLANFEAMCAGLPAVCSAVGAVPEVAGDGAWLVPNDPATLQRCIQAMMDDEGLRQSWSRRALARTAAWPDAAAIAQRYVDIYQAPRR